MDDIGVHLPKVAAQAPDGRRQPVLLSHQIDANTALAQGLPERANGFQTRYGRSFTAACDYEVVDQTLEPSGLERLDDVQNTRSAAAHLKYP